MIDLLVWFLIFAVVVWLAFFILGHITMAEPVRTVITVVVAVVLLLILLYKFAPLAGLH